MVLSVLCIPSPLRGIASRHVRRRRISQCSLTRAYLQNTHTLEFDLWTQFSYDIYIVFDDIYVVIGDIYIVFKTLK